VETFVTQAEELERVELVVLESKGSSGSDVLSRPPAGDHNYVLAYYDAESPRRFARRVLRRTRQALRGQRELTKVTCVLGDGTPGVVAVRTRLLRGLLCALSRRGVCRLLGSDEHSSGVFECVAAVTPSLRPGAGLEVRLFPAGSSPTSSPPPATSGLALEVG
jgi:hypothetical protein